MADDLLPRVEKVEIKVDRLDVRVTDIESQLGRITSHIESELGLARRDTLRVERRLFGDEDDEYGGRFGQMTKRVYRIEVWFLATIGAAGIIGFLLAMYEWLVKNVK